MRRFVSLSIFLVCLLSLSFLFGQTPPPPTQAAAAMSAGLQHLKDSKWKQATESFDTVIMLAPAYAPAHMGKLCAELKVTEEKLLGDLVVGIDGHPFFGIANLL
jgi:Tfp pilus assembly protein PilF